jgi:hypothetical protein
MYPKLDRHSPFVIPLYLLEYGSVGYFHISTPIKSVFCGLPPGTKVKKIRFEKGATYKFGSKDFSYVYEVKSAKDGHVFEWNLHYVKNETELRHIYICQNKDECCVRRHVTSW